MTQMRRCLSRANLLLPRVIFVLCFLGHFNSKGQDRCPSHLQTYQEDPFQFESWLSQINKQNSGRPNNEILTIPVVFHIIHRGEPVGQGSNLSFSRIEQQMTTLNADFRRNNADAMDTPSDFLSVAADTQIEFVLARQDPNGLPTTGVTRTQGNLLSYRFSDDFILKSEAYWPAEDYMNIYVADLEGFLGWATFPFSNLAGIDEINNNRRTDGVALDYEYVGINQDANEFESLGRTGTHEVGHFLGLKHVWGDGGCEVDDFCADTPLSRISYQGECPSDDVVSCTELDMYSNFLNYTNDACMNLFTVCQRERMRTVLTNSIRRKSLLSSPALEAPTTVVNDLGISSVTGVSDAFCNEATSPLIEVRNFGNNAISLAEIQVSVADEVREVMNLDLGLEPGDITSVEFSPLNLDPTANHTIHFEIRSVNGTTDGNDANNIDEIIIPPVFQRSLPMVLDFESDDALITRTEISESSLWQTQNAPFQNSRDMAAQLDFFNNEDNLGEFHYLLLPRVDFTNINSAQLTFRYAYSGRSGMETKDGLILAASQDCGVTFDRILFSSYGNSLITVDRNISASFIPTGPADWETVTLNITSELSPNLRFAFIGQNGAQNNIYIDDIQIEATNLDAYDLGITDVTQLPVVTCSDFISPRITVENFGFETISEYQLRYELSGGNGQQDITTALISGGSETNAIPIGGLAEGTYSLTLSTVGPNQQSDENPLNDTYTRNIVINDTKETLPFRESFDSPDDWATVNPTGNSLWEVFDTGNGAVRASAFQTSDLGDQHWLVTPTLNTGRLTEGTLSFRMAHAQNGNALDRLQVLLSVNCGQSYDQIIYDKSGEELSTTNATSEFFAGTEDWRIEQIDISEYMVWRDIRLAFVFTNGGGNNLYLDEVEIIPLRPEFIRDFDQSLSVFPNPATDRFTVTLNMPRKEEVIVSLIDMSGRIITQFREPNGLNQAYQFQVADLNGIYLVQVDGNDFKTTRRVIIRK